MNTTAINWSDIETVQPVSSCNQFANEVEGIRLRFRHSVGRFTVRTIYRHQLRMYRRMAQFIDRHNVLSNLWIGGWGVAGIIYFIMYA